MIKDWEMEDQLTFGGEEPEHDRETDDDEREKTDRRGGFFKAARDARAAATKRIETGSAAASGVTAAARRTASEKASDIAAKAAGEAKSASSKVAGMVGLTKEDVPGKAAGAKFLTSKRVRDRVQSTTGVTGTFVNQLMEAAPTVLASNLSIDLNRSLQGMVEGSATIYDKAMDANYLDPLLRSDMGGSYHRLFDGGHTIGGAFEAARNASTEDTFIEEALGTVQGLLRDGNHCKGTSTRKLGQGDVRRCGRGSGNELSDTERLGLRPKHLRHS